MLRDPRIGTQIHPVQSNAAAVFQSQEPPVSRPVACRPPLRERPRLNKLQWRYTNATNTSNPTGNGGGEADGSLRRHACSVLFLLRTGRGIHAHGHGAGIWHSIAGSNVGFKPRFVCRRATAGGRPRARRTQNSRYKLAATRTCRHFTGAVFSRCRTLRRDQDDGASLGAWDRTRT